MAGLENMHVLDMNEYLDERESHANVMDIREHAKEDVPFFIARFAVSSTLKDTGEEYFAVQHNVEISQIIPAPVIDWTRIRYQRISPTNTDTVSVDILHVRANGIVAPGGRLKTHGYSELSEYKNAKIIDGYLLPISAKLDPKKLKGNLRSSRV